MKRKPTRQVRIAQDLAEMLGGLTDVRGPSAAEFLDPLVRSEITRLYKEIEPVVKRIRRAKASVSKAG
jgi:hypothetical protein